jgi:phosphopantothenoylcysteine decarboxylase/phosphopantothenate--cysteine ligase
VTDRLTVVFGITGGIAAYKAVGAIRLLVTAGHDVHVVPTENALRFVGLPTLEAISGNPVTTSLYEGVDTVRHVALGQSADLIVIAPATANTLAKLATGQSDDLLGTTVLASTAPLVVAPAMHTGMWQNAATVANVEVLRSRGVVVVGPESGRLTGPDDGPGRMSEPADIVRVALETVGAGVASAPGDLDGLRVVVSAGGTREPLDPVRFLGNRSSGKQGVAVARAAATRGARVTLVAAHLDTDVAAAAAALPGVDVVSVGTAEELAAEVERHGAAADVVVMAAAVADYRPATVSESKIKKDATGDSLTITLERTPDVLATLAATPIPGRTVVGFAAETAVDRDELLALGRAKMVRKGADLLVLNSVGWTEGFGADDNVATVIDREGGGVAESAGSKDEVAHAVLDAIVAQRSR